MEVHISQAVLALFDRGSAPQAVRARRRFGQIPAGADLVWDGEMGVYVCGEQCVLPHRVRSGLGVDFEPVSTPAGERV